jgi:hypothetical protein
MTTQHRPFRNWNLDKTLSLLAFLISLGTFFLLFYQTNLTRKQQYAAVLPFLKIFNRNPREEDYTFAIVNNGIGPAFIETVEIIYQGKTFRMDPANFLYREIYPKDSVSFSYTNLSEKKLIPTGAELELMVVQGSAKDAKILRKLFGNATAVLQLTYASVYGERWEVSSGNAPIKLK